MTTKRKLLWSTVSAIGFLFLSYCITNLRFPISGEKDVLLRFELLRNYFFPVKDSAPDSVLMINVCYDKQMIPAYDEYGFAKGRHAITDRRKLLLLLEELKRRGDYKYILMDVFLGESSRTEYDSALVETILSMPRIVIPARSTEELISPRLEEKAGMAEYITTFDENSFVKYPFLTSHSESMPAKMYAELTGHRLRQQGFLFVDNGKVVRRSMVLTFEMICREPYTEEGEKTWYHLGTDLLNDSIDEDTCGDNLLYEAPELTRNKYILIGAFEEEDIHESYMMDVQGILINYNAYLALLHQHHFLSVSVGIILFAAFFILCYLIFSQRTMKEEALHSRMAMRIPLKAARRLVLALCSWVGFSLFLIVLCISTYVFLGEAYDIFITATLFWLFKLIVNIIQKRKKHE